MEPEVAEFAQTFQKFMEVMTRYDDRVDELTAVGREVSDFLGVPLADLDPVSESFPQHQLVDVDQALETIRTECGGRLIGVRGPDKAEIESFGEFLERTHFNFRVGAPSYQRVPVGPQSDRRAVSFGIALLTFDGERVVWLQRAPNLQYGRDQHTLEVLCAHPATIDALLARVQTEMESRSLLRGQVISFQANEFDYHVPGAALIFAPGAALTFLPRPEVPADAVILPDGVLDRIVAHVVDIGAQRDSLLAAGQHLKRGVLLYGPPGTGKTHVIRHLIARTPGTTVVLLTGRTLGLLPHAARLARAAPPAIVVLEDCDLIAEERGGDASNAALFETLEALDGLDGDADVTFILTTNRPDLLEHALTERPGRVDLAVQIDKPDQTGRLRLLQLYAATLIAEGHLSHDALEAAAASTDGVTASFAKELVRRIVLAAARDQRQPTDDDVTRAVEDMQSDSELFTRVLLGGDGSVFSHADDPSETPPRWVTKD